MVGVGIGPPNVLRCAEAHVVGQDEQDVRRTFRRLDLLRKIKSGIFDGGPNVPSKGLIRSWQHVLCRGRSQEYRR